MTKLFTKLARDNKGVTAIEYGLIAAFIALALVAVVPNISHQLGNTFGSVNNALSNAQQSSSSGS
jgi:pilus assembly protein Flp/PilA